jgi:hypothetical protein
VSFAIDDLKNLIYARKDIKNETCTIYYTNKQATYEEVLNTRQYIVGSTIADFVKDHIIDDEDNLEKFWWHQTGELLFDRPYPKGGQVLRLYLNLVEMYKHRVTISELAKAFEREEKENQMIMTLHGPIGDGIIDIYPIESKIMEDFGQLVQGSLSLTRELIENAFLEDVFQELPNIRVKGVSGIRNLFPIVSPVLRVVMSEQLISEAAEKTVSGRLSQWALFYNQRLMKTIGVEPANLAALCDRAGLTIIDNSRQDFLVVALPPDEYRDAWGETIIRDEDGSFLRKLEGEIMILGTSRYYKITNRVVNEKTGEKWFNPTNRGWRMMMVPEKRETHWVERITPPQYEDLEPDDLVQINEDFYYQIKGGVLTKGETRYEKIINPLVLANLRTSKPSEYINGKISQAKQQHQKNLEDEIRRVKEVAAKLPEIQGKLLLRKAINVKRPALLEASEFIIAETEGSNLRDLMALRGIDRTRTTCNYMHTISDTLGIEATLTFLIRQLYNTITNASSYVHPSNLILIAEFITSRGYPYGATFTGVSRQPGGHLSLATFERAGEVFTQSASYGRREDIKNVSASVVLGARMAIGSGMCDIIQEIKVNGEPTKIINDDVFTDWRLDDSVAPETKKVGPDYVNTASKYVMTYGGDEEEEGLNTNLLYSFGEVPLDLVPEQPATLDQLKGKVPVNDLVKVGIPVKGPKALVPPSKKAPVSIISTGLIAEPVTSLPTFGEVPSGLWAAMDSYANLEAAQIMEVTKGLPKFTSPKSVDYIKIDVQQSKLEIQREKIRRAQEKI